MTFVRKSVHGTGSHLLYNEPAFDPSFDLLNLTKEWEELEEESFQKLFKNQPSKEPNLKV